VQQPGSQDRELVTVTLFQNVSILGVGDQLLGRSAGEGEPAVAGGNTVTVALDPQETALLLFAREQGQVSLALRSRMDKDQRIEVPPANMASLIQSVMGSEAVVEAPSPAPQRTVEVFKALERTVVAIND